VWQWITEADRLRRWLADEVEAVGEGELRLTGVADDGEPRIERFQTVAAGEDTLLVVSFERLEQDWESATKLSFSLKGESPCELTVLQQGFERLTLSSCMTVWEFYRRRWRSAFERLDAEICGASAERPAD
jgi:hypothetical protein